MSALGSAAAVLRLFSPERTDLSVTEAAALLGLPKSTVSRLTRAMREAGFLDLVEGTRRYRPGALVLAVGHAHRRGASLLAQAREGMERVSRGCGHTGYVSVLEGAEVVGVAAHGGSKGLRVGTPPGVRLRAFATATGRSLLARLDDATLRALHPDPLLPPNGHAPADLAALMRGIEAVRRQGFCLSRHEANAGVESLAVAVGDPATGEAASLCIVFPSSMVTPAERDNIRAALLAEARAIAARTGDPHHESGAGDAPCAA